MEDWPYRRCAFCRQLFDPREPDEIAHHVRRKGPHKKMPGIPDDGLETIPLDFDPPQPRRPGEPEPGPWTPKREILPYKTMRKGRRKKSEFKG
ncbi:MAG: hypothetical protein AB7H66_02880 [Hyphomonadaceae bacterium]